MADAAVAPPWRKPQMPELWPHGVGCTEDMIKFCRLIGGPNAKIVDKSDVLPDDSGKCFLFIIKGGCAQNSPWAEMEQHAKAVHADVMTLLKNEGHNQPERGVQVGKSLSPHYQSVQLCGDSCTCSKNFGGEKHKDNLPVDCNAYPAGMEYSKFLYDTLNRHHQAMRGQELLHDKAEPVWLHLSYHALFNNYKVNQFLDAHSDQHDTYRSGNPITSFNMGQYGGILTFDSCQYKKHFGTRAIYQEVGDISVMGGECQKLVRHGVPALKDWKEFQMTPGLTPEDRVCIASDLQRWEQTNSVQQFKPGAVCPDMLRWNSTLRWHAVHLPGCIAGRGQAASRQLVDAVTLTQPAVPDTRPSTGHAVAMLDLNSMQTSDAASSANVVMLDVNSIQTSDAAPSADVAMLDVKSIRTSDAAPSADANQVLQARIDLLSAARERESAGAQWLARAIDTNEQKIKVYMRALLGLEYFGNASVREAQWAEIQDLLDDLERQEQVQLGLLDAFPDNRMVSQILQAKGLRAIPVIQSAFRLKAKLNMGMRQFEERGCANIFQEGTSPGRVSKLGQGKQAHTKVLLTHGMLKRFSSSINVRVLQTDGELVWDLRRWSDESIVVDHWIRKPGSKETDSYVIGTMNLKPAHTQLFVHAIDFGFESDEFVKRVSVRKDISKNACAKLSAKPVAQHLCSYFVVACDLLRAVDVKELHASWLSDDILERYKIPVWVSLYDPAEECLFTSLDENFAATSKKARDCNWGSQDGWYSWQCNRWQWQSGRGSSSTDGQTRR